MVSIGKRQTCQASESCWQWQGRLHVHTQTSMWKQQRNMGHVRRSPFKQHGSKGCMLDSRGLAVAQEDQRMFSRGSS